ncbi:MAG: hypothetical protein KatS3mg020_0182 [Fimbriimonadales bacterium]|nr:MAG: hypothetical protein KatS3mg019_1196 [Fimbriimonadales bacterium]GIV10691.1 MAG: hypothetical protein KatS3mg020_0182 [Fimbriimonadales bacterium]
MSKVAIHLPSNKLPLEGVLVGVDKTAMQFAVRLETPAEVVRAHTTAQAILVIGGVPRQLTVQIDEVQDDLIRMTPISGGTLYERRTRKRYAVNLPAQLNHGDQWLSVKVINIGVGGLGVRSPQPLEKGRRYAIEFVLVGADQPFQAHIEARHSRLLDGEQWYIGAAFVELSRTDELWLRKLFP